MDEALALAEKFWEQLQAILDKLDALAETLKNQDPPAVEPKAIQKQQDALKEIKKDIEKVKPEVNNCRQSGQNLLKVIGDQDKPEIKKNIEELDNAWEVRTLYQFCCLFINEGMPKHFVLYFTEHYCFICQA